MLLRMLGMGTPMTLKNRHIWLLGASEGIGHAVAQLLAQQGAILALSARQHDKLELLAASLAGSGHLVLPLDVQNAASVVAAYQSLRKAWGMPAMVIYNAGYYEPMTTQKFELALVEKMLDINVGGAVRVLAQILPDFIAANAGHIVLVGSIAAYRGLPGAIGYGASKAALLHLAENMAVDLQHTNIKVQIISPGFVKTRLTAKNDFAMPQIIEADQAARHIVAGLQSNQFEIAFPWGLSTLLKMLRWLPARIYFRLLRSRRPAQQ